MDKEKWKEEVMSSLLGIKRAEPNPFLFTRIEERIEKKYGKLAVWKVRLAVAAMLVLLVVNSVILLREPKQGAYAPSSEYQLSSIQIY
jgi:hypothetical protein